MGKTKELLEDIYDVKEYEDFYHKMISNYQPSVCQCCGRESIDFINTKCEYCGTEHAKNN